MLVYFVILSLTTKRFNVFRFPGLFALDCMLRLSLQPQVVARDCRPMRRWLLVCWRADVLMYKLVTESMFVSIRYRPESRLSQNGNAGKRALPKCEAQASILCLFHLHSIAFQNFEVLSIWSEMNGSRSTMAQCKNRLILVPYCTILVQIISSCP